MKNDHRTQQAPLRQVLSKAPTGISGLDEVLGGGLPRARTTIVNGGPGSGKTLLGLEFLYRGALAGEPGIFIGFEEPLDQLRENAATLGWDLAALERENRLFLLGGHIQPDMLTSGEFSLKGLLAAASGKATEKGAKRIVMDALEVALRLFDTPRKVRNELHTLNDWLRGAGLAALLTVRPGVRGGALAFEDFFHSMGDCVIDMDVRMVAQISTRRLRIVKYRGSDYQHNEYPYVITGTGLHVAPISTVGLRHKPLGEKITTGQSKLDGILDGGYRRASCVLFAGQPGTGKTTLASTFARTACGRGENVLYISFEESQEALTGNVRNAGIDLQSAIASGRLRFLCQFPEAMGAEEHYIRALAAIEDFSPAHVIVDAVSACERMGGKQAAFEYLMRLLNRCKEKGITILLINQTSDPKDITEISGNGISSLVDTVIRLDYKEGFGETTRLLSVLKSRGSAHSNQKREYWITDQGIDVAEPYLGEGEVLTGTARQVQEEKDRMEAERLEFEIRLKELEIERLHTMQRRMANGIERRTALRADKPLDDKPQEG